MFQQSTEFWAAKKNLTFPEFPAWKQEFLSYICRPENRGGIFF